MRSSNRFLYSAAVISVGVLLLACDYFCQIIYSLLRRTSAPGTYWPYPNVRRASASELIARYIDDRIVGLAWKVGVKRTSNRDIETRGDQSALTCC